VEWGKKEAKVEKSLMINPEGRRGRRQSGARKRMQKSGTGKEENVGGEEETQAQGGKSFKNSDKKRAKGGNTLVGQKKAPNATRQRRRARRKDTTRGEREKGENERSKPSVTKANERILGKPKRDRNKAGT